MRFLCGAGMLGLVCCGRWWSRSERALSLYVLGLVRLNVLDSVGLVWFVDERMCRFPLAWLSRILIWVPKQYLLLVNIEYNVKLYRCKLFVEARGPYIYCISDSMGEKELNP